MPLRWVGWTRRPLSDERFEQLLLPWDRRTIHVLVLLRLAVLLHRGQRVTTLPDIQLLPRSRSLEIRFPMRWLREHPLTVADLRQEIELLRAADFRLRVYSSRGLPAV